MEHTWRACALAAILPVLCLAACDAPHEADDEARRITDSRLWAEEQAAAAARMQPRQPVAAIALPDDLPSPELFETTRQIYAELEKNAGDTSLQPYAEQIPSIGGTLRMVPVPAGEFTMGSSDTEPLREKNEGPQRKVALPAYWISEIEIPWELYTAFMQNGRPRAKDGKLLEERPDDELWDLVVQPTAPYASMNLGMGNGYENGMPAIAMSHYAASKFCEWLSAQTGHYYRLPTEAEWEYACRAGSDAAYCYGDGEEKLEEYGWYWNNSNDRYQKAATKKPNAWGIYDMHGNVAEWVLDTYRDDAYSGEADKTLQSPLVLEPGKPGHVVRGGSWEDDPDRLRSAARRRSRAEWNMQDPQNPKSLWYLTNGGMIGFRVVRPATLPDILTVHRLWNASKGLY